jgi:hypothetical protein
MSAPTTATKHTNRLIHETSPYLLQHAHNPVDWYAWGPEAFAAARHLDKPIFLSVGYSTCYWCHVMERQCFENEQIAEEMNRRFVNIKVDREERPDVDQLYMTAVQVLTRQGGWPMSVFLTPDLRPFYGGTYFPPTDANGRPGFLTVLRAIEGSYHERRDDVRTTAAQLTEILRQFAEPPLPETPITINREFIGDLVRRSVADFDAAHGGFGGAPKFPRETLLEMLLMYVSERTEEGEFGISDFKSQILAMVRRTLDAMAEGGIHDPWGGGFHRYATDERWLTPHFEIMLYDNAMLGWVYTEAYRQTREMRYAKVARGIFNYVLRVMTSPAGAFYTALDAEVDAKEGWSYLWTKEEVEKVLSGKANADRSAHGFAPEDIELFHRVYGLDRGPNFADPHHGTGAADRSILYLPESLPAVAEAMRVTVEELERRLAPMRQKLYSARRRRKQPSLDTKIITSWNALMIRALAYGGRVLEEPSYREAAARAADFLLANHVKSNGDLWRTSREGSAKHDAFLDDYAFLAQALIELRNCEGKEHYRQRANALAMRMVERFGDREKGSFYFTAEGAADLIVRQKVAQDSPLPSGNAVAAMVMLELEQAEVAEDTLSVFARSMEQHPEGMSSMIEAAMVYLRSNEPIAVSPGPWMGGEDKPISPEQMAQSVVSLHAEWESAAELHVHVKIAEGFHLNAHQMEEGLALPPPRGLVATRLSAGEYAGEMVQSVDFPPGEKQRFAFAEAPMHVYAGTVTIVVRFKRSMTGQPPVPLALLYQACNYDTCLPAVTKRLEVGTP